MLFYIVDVLRFDNTYSWMTAKQLSYQIEVLEPDKFSGIHISPSFMIPNNVAAEQLDTQTLAPQMSSKET